MLYQIEANHVIDTVLLGRITERVGVRTLQKLRRRYLARLKT